MAAATKRRTPPVNAELVEIGRVELVSDGGGGHTEEYVEKWSGAVPAYVTEKVGIHALDTQVVERASTQISFAAGLLAEVDDGAEFGPGWRLTVARLGSEASEQRRVEAVEDRRDYGYIRAYTQEVT